MKPQPHRRPERGPDDNTSGHEGDKSTLRLSRALSITEFCRLYGIGRTNAYQEISVGRLRAIKAGRRTLITVEAAEAWLAGLPEFQLRRNRTRSGE